MKPTSRGSVLFVVHKEYPLQEVRVRREAEAAAAAGWSVDVLALLSPDEPRRVCLNGVRVFRTPVERMRDYTLSGLAAEYGRFFLATLWHSLTHRYDRVVVANPPDFLIFAALNQRLHGARVFLDVHDLMTDLFFLRMEASPRWTRDLLRILERMSMRAVDELITVHGPYAQEVMRRSGNRRPVTVVMNSANEAYFERRSPGLRAPAFAFYGSLFERNGLFELIDAFEAVAEISADCELWLWGDGDCRDALVSRAQESPYRSRIRFSNGMRPMEDVSSMLSKAGFCVVPNRPDLHNSKALSCKLLEATAVGVPVIAGDLAVTTEHFNGDEILYYNAGSTEGLACAMKFALDHPDEMEAMADRAHERYLRDYAWPGQRDRLLRLLAR